ncbi:2Fe-2S iron-sulfur cluster-binding protein [Streptomyces sp. NPDC055287]
MSENENPGTPAPPNPGGWQPIPQGGEYDAEATAFVQLPEGMTDFGAYGDPLAAPGHDYVPPQISSQMPASADPGATGTWSVPQETPGEMRWPEPESAQPPAPAHEAGATGQWSFESAPEPTPPVASELTGQWTIPVADGDLPDESGEFTTSALASQWATTHPPATLPGGAPSPWANTSEAGPTLPGGAPAPWAAQPPRTADFEPHPTQDAPGPAARGTVPGEDAQRRSSQGVEGNHPGPHHVPEGSAPEEAPRHGTDPDAPATPAAATAGDAPQDEAHSEHPHASYVLRVNGADRPVTDAWIGESLLYVLRERLGLAGAKDGCSQGECGACAVQVDGRLVASCLVPAATTAGSEVRTVEGLATDGEPSDVQRALANCGAVQCGFCVPGMAMTVHDLLEGNHAPSDLETRQALCGNLCRCSGYRGVLEAVREVVAERDATAAAEEARIPHQAPPGAGGIHPSHPHEHPHDGGMA